MSPVTLAPFPHAGGCAGCRKAGQCSGCGDKLVADRKRCTNGRCGPCHAKYCGPGPSATVHGYGDVGDRPHVVEVPA